MSAEELAAALTLLDDRAPGQAPQLPLEHAVMERLLAKRVAERARVVRFPLRYTTNGARRTSRRYLTVPVDVDGVGFVDFCWDAGTWSALITPELRSRLGMSELDGAAVTALNSSGPTIRQRVPLPEMWLGTHRLPPLRAYVSKLPAAQRKDVGGLLGVKVLRRFDIDINFKANEVALHPAGHAAAHLLDTAGLSRVSCKYIKAGVVCIPVSLNGSPPFLGILDLSAAVSILNWEAAALVGMQCDKGSSSTSSSTSASSTAGSSTMTTTTSSAAASSSSSSSGSSGMSSSSTADSSSASSSSATSPGPDSATDIGSNSSAIDSSSHESSTAAAAAERCDDADVGISSSMEEQLASTTAGSISDDSNFGFFGVIHVHQDPELIRPASSDHHSRQPHHGPHTHHAASAAEGAGLQHSRESSGQRASPSSSSHTGSSPWPPLRLPPELRDPRTSSSSSPQGSSPPQQRKRPAAPQPRGRPSGKGWAGAASSDIVRLQVHRVAISEFSLRLGVDKLGGSMLLQPPAQLAVSALRGLQQLGLGGRPAMVIGHDIWARQRAVLSIRAGAIYMASPQQ